MRGDLYTAYFLKGEGVAEVQRGRAVAHDQLLAVTRQAPTCGCIGESGQRLERVDIVGESLLRLPGELDQAIGKVGETLGEEARFQRVNLQHFAGRERDFAQRGLAVETGALVQEAVAVEQALGEGARVMRIGCDHFVAVDRNLARRFGWGRVGAIVRFGRTGEAGGQE